MCHPYIESVTALSDFIQNSPTTWSLCCIRFAVQFQFDNLNLSCDYQFYSCFVIYGINEVYAEECM